MPQVPYVTGLDEVKAYEHRAFHECSLKELGSGHASVNGQIFAWIDLTIDIIFLVDMWVILNSAKWIIDNQGREHWRLVDDVREIRRLYIRDGPLPQFWTDILGVIPWQYIDCFQASDGESTGTDLNFVKILRLLRLLKLLRLYRIRRMIESLQFKYPHAVFFIRSGQLLISLALMAHWLGCLWFSIGYTQGGWLQLAGMIDDNLQPTDIDSGAMDWVTTVYWAITTMTTIGYGDISAGTLEERALASIVMIIGCAFFAWSTGTITSILTGQDHCVRRFREKLEEVSEFLSARDLPQDVQERVKSFYMLKFPTMRIYDEERVLCDLPYGLQKQVRLELFKDVIALAPMFYGVSSSLHAQLCMYLMPTYKTEGMEITTEGELPDGLYITRFGLVSVCLNGEEIFEAQTGDVFGENALLGLSLDGKRQRTCIAKTMCELCKLHKEDLTVLLKIEEFRRPLRIMLQAHLAHLEVLLSSDQPIAPYMLYCVNWAEIKVRVQHARSQAAPLKAEHNLADKALRRTLSQHLAAGSGFLVTEVHLVFRTMKAHASLHNVELVIAASWPGYHSAHESLRIAGLPCRAFSEVQQCHATTDTCGRRAGGGAGNGRAGAEAEAEGDFVLNAALSLPVTHQNSRWEEMPPIRFVVYKLLRSHGVKFSAPEGHLLRLDDEDFDLRLPCAEAAAQERQAGLDYFAAGAIDLKAVTKARTQHFRFPYDKDKATEMRVVQGFHCFKGGHSEQKLQLNVYERPAVVQGEGHHDHALVHRAHPLVKKGLVQKRGQPPFVDLRTRFFVLEGTTVRYFASESDYSAGAEPKGEFSCLGLEVESDVGTSSDGCHFKLYVLSEDNPQQHSHRLDQLMRTSPTARDSKHRKEIECVCQSASERLGWVAAFELAARHAGDQSGGTYSKSVGSESHAFAGGGTRALIAPAGEDARSGAMAVIDLQIEVQRQLPLGSKWRRVMSLMRKSAPSPYFRDRQRHLVNGLRHNVNANFMHAELKSLAQNTHSTPKSMWLDMDAPSRRRDLERLYKDQRAVAKDVGGIGARLNLVEHAVLGLNEKTEDILSALEHLGAPVTRKQSGAAVFDALQAQAQQHRDAGDVDGAGGYGEITGRGAGQVKLHQERLSADEDEVSRDSWDVSVADASSQGQVEPQALSGGPVLMEEYAQARVPDADAAQRAAAPDPGPEPLSGVGRGVAVCTIAHSSSENQGANMVATRLNGDKEAAVPHGSKHPLGPGASQASRQERSKAHGGMTRREERSERGFRTASSGRSDSGPEINFSARMHDGGRGLMMEPPLTYSSAAGAGGLGEGSASTKAAAQLSPVGAHLGTQIDGVTVFDV